MRKHVVKDISGVSYFWNKTSEQDQNIHCLSDPHYAEGYMNVTVIIIAFVDVTEIVLSS